MLGGSLRRKVTLERATVTQDGYGEEVPSFATLATVWARVEPIIGKERFAAVQTQSDVDHRITCRYSSAIASLAADDRITWGSKTYDIRSVVNTEERNIELQIFATLHT